MRLTQSAFIHLVSAFIHSGLFILANDFEGNMKIRSTVLLLFSVLIASSLSAGKKSLQLSGLSEDFD